MTYLDKLLRGIKFDGELLTPREIETLRFCINTSMFSVFGCPGNVFAGAPTKSGSCNQKWFSCIECWDQEA